MNAEHHSTVNAAERPSQWQPKKSRRAMILFSLTMLIAMVGILYIWRLPPFSLNKVITNNAYIRGQTTLLSPKVNGYVAQVLVQDFAKVVKNQPLVKIDDAPYQAKVAQAQANLLAQQANLDKMPQTRLSSEATLTARKAGVDNAKAQLQRAEIEMKRIDELLKSNAASKREHDQAVANLKQAQANLTQAQAQYHMAQQDMANLNATEKALVASVANAKANLDLAQQDLDNCIVLAPNDGRLSEIGVKQGQFVSAGSQLMYLVPEKHWVIANFKEADTQHIQLGQKANIRVDALGGELFEGVVSEIAPATASEFSLIKADSGTGNFVKIAQRIAVKIELAPHQAHSERIAPGMSVEAEILFH